MPDVQHGAEGDSSAPSVAWLLGETSNYQVDRDLGEEMIAKAPGLRAAARANRSFHQRAPRHLAEAGIAQFIDLGSGLPTPGSTHEIVLAARAHAQVVYAPVMPTRACAEIAVTSWT